jgi:nicotinate-nucleotide adenylyltransferase
MKKIGFFGGSFDPIHFGHLHLAIDMLEKHGLDEVLFCPAFCSPFKIDRPPIASGEERLQMLKLVLADIPQFRVTPIEIERHQPSYTVETLRKLPKAEYRLILTKESAATFTKWKEPEEIKRLAPLLIGERAFPISSSEIRERLKKKLYCGHLVPEKALAYIQQHCYTIS